MPLHRLAECSRLDGRAAPQQVTMTPTEPPAPPAGSGSREEVGNGTQSLATTASGCAATSGPTITTHLHGVPTRGVHSAEAVVGVAALLHACQVHQPNLASNLPAGC